MRFVSPFVSTVGGLTTKVRDIGRMREVARILISHGMGILVANVDIPGMGGVRTQTFESNPERVSKALQELGPTFIKFGQILSTRGDVIPAAYLEALQGLQDEVSPLPFSEIEEQLQLELGVAWRSRLAEFDVEPIATASMAQVHRGILMGGREVVFKIRRPGILKQVKSDLSILQVLAKRMIVEYPNTTYFDPEGILREFERALDSEMDFAQEASNIRHFEEMFASDPTVRIPSVVDDLTTSAVLCMDYLDGVRIRDARSAGFNMPLIGQRYLDLNYRMLLEYGFFHGDLHPGNVLVLPGDIIGLLDFGMTGRLTRDMRNDLVSMIFALERGDFRTVARIFYDNGIKIGRVDYPAFERDVVDLIHRNWHGSIQDLQVGHFLTDLAQGAIHHRVRTPHSFTMFFKALLTTEGLAKSLIPEVDPLAAARPYVERLVAERFSPQRIKEDLFYNVVTANSLLNRLPTTLSQFMDDLDQQRLHINVNLQEHEESRESARNRDRLLVHTMVGCTSLICGTACLFVPGPTILDQPALVLLFYFGALVAWLRAFVGMRDKH
ncbi:MAG: AarF/UbiB family protein [Myxococcota bacterium]|nr:AarF/UbiB family protein [Myxococcota bacterium]